MKLSKKVFISSILISTCVLSFAHESSTATGFNEEETSVESEYLDEIDNVEGEVISALSKSSDLATKLTALHSLQEAIDGGNTSKSVIASLDRLAGEGVLTEERNNGRIINYFPDIRKMACQTMAKLPTEHSQKILSSIALRDEEPGVIAAAVQSLGTIGINVDETINTIAWASKKKRRANPDSILAREVLKAFDKLSGLTTNTATINTMINEITDIANVYNYPLPIRKDALDLLRKLRKSKELNSSENEVNEK